MGGTLETLLGSQTFLGGLQTFLGGGAPVEGPPNVLGAFLGGCLQTTIRASNQGASMRFQLFRWPFLGPPWINHSLTYFYPRYGAMGPPFGIAGASIPKDP